MSSIAFHSTETPDGIIENAKGYIDMNNRVELDRLGRKVKFVNMYDLHIEPETLRPLASVPVEPKYRADYKRMKPDLVWLYKEAVRQENSRQLVAYNQNPDKTQIPCFNFFHFQKNAGDKGFHLYIYQRSQDLDKMKSDLRFFLSIVEEFEEKTGYEVKYIMMKYGNIHYEEGK